MILPHVSAQDVPYPAAWLDIVWSLVVLGKALPKQVASVLDSEFHSKLINSTGEFSCFIILMRAASSLTLECIHILALFHFICVCVFQCQPTALLRTSGSAQDR